MIQNSVLLKPIFLMIQIINTSYENSFFKRIIDFIGVLLRRLNNAYENSFTAYVAKSVTGLLYNSAIIGFLTRKGRLSKWWENSLVYKIIDTCIKVPSKILKGIYQKYEDVFLASIILKLIRTLLFRVEYIAGVLLVIILIVPHQRWNNIYNLGIAVFLVGLIFINTVIQRHWILNFKALDFTLVLFMVTVVLSYITSTNPSLSMKYLLFYVAGFLFVLAIASSVKNEKSLETLIQIMLFGVTAIGLFGLWQVLTDAVPFDPSLTDVDMNQNMPGRVYATMANPNNYAEILIMTLPFYFSIIMNSKTFFKRVVYIMLALPPLMALFYTGSRSSWIGFAVSILVITFFTNRRLVPLVILGGITFIPFLPQHVNNRILTIFNALQDTSTQTRFKIVQTVMPMFKNYIFTGTGLGTDIFIQIVRNYHQYTKAVPPHSHILYFQVWIEMGVAGFISFMWYIYRTIKNSIIGIYSSTKILKNILVAGTASLLGILVTATAEYIWYYPRVMVIFWVVLGILTAAATLAENKNRKLSEAE